MVNLLIYRFLKQKIRIINYLEIHFGIVRGRIMSVDIEQKI